MWRRMTRRITSLSRLPFTVAGGDAGGASAAADPAMKNRTLSNTHPRDFDMPRMIRHDPRMEYVLSGGGFGREVRIAEVRLDVVLDAGHQDPLGAGRRDRRAEREREEIDRVIDDRALVAGQAGRLLLDRSQQAAGDRGHPRPTFEARGGHP